MEAAGLRQGAEVMYLNALRPNHDEHPRETYIRFARYMVDSGDGIKLLYTACQGYST